MLVDYCRLLHQRIVNQVQKGTSLEIALQMRTMVQKQSRMQTRSNPRIIQSLQRLQKTTFMSGLEGVKLQMPTALLKEYENSL